VSESPAVLMDFGSVTDERVVISDRQTALQTQENAERYSTAPYRAPELWDVASACVIDGKVDVWAAGCVLYYMMVGETPFERISNQAGGSLMLSVLNGSYTWPDTIPVSRMYANIVQACLTVDPTARPTIRHVLDMLDTDGGVPAETSSTKTHSVPPTAPPVARPPPPPVARPPPPAAAERPSVPAHVEPLTSQATDVPNLIDL
jgi:serine/threonine protein kinase